MKHAQKNKVMLLQFVEFVFVLQTCVLFNIVLKFCVLVFSIYISELYAEISFLCLLAIDLNSHFLCTILQNMCTYLKNSKLMNVPYNTL